MSPQKRDAVSGPARPAASADTEISICVATGEFGKEGTGMKLRSQESLPGQLGSIYVALATHRRCFHHVGLRKHYRPTNGFVHYPVVRYTLVLIVDIRDLLLHYLAKRLRAALGAGVEPAWLARRDALEQNLLCFVSDHLYRDSSSEGQNLSH